jgi:hypothetical protein
MSVCHVAHFGTFLADFGEPDTGEVRRMHLLGTWVNKARARVTSSCYTGFLPGVLLSWARSEGIAVPVMGSPRRFCDCERLAFVADGDLIRTSATATTHTVLGRF